MFKHMRVARWPAPRISIALTIAMVGSAMAYGHAGHGSGHVSKPSPEEQAAFANARPAFERHCVRCHTTGGKKAKRKSLDHFSMNDYPFKGHHADEAGAVVRKVLGAGADHKATMPSDDPGAVTGDDLTKILAWADAFERAHPPKQEHSHAH
jgi:hypothetical protein